MRGGWKIYYFDGRPSNLFELKPGRGYMLFMNEPASLIINGSKMRPDLGHPQFNLRLGWNLIGTFSIRRAAQDILKGVDYNQLYLYNESSNRSEMVEPEMQLNETKSYWIYIVKESVMSPVIGEGFLFPIEIPKVSGKVEPLGEIGK